MMDVILQIKSKRHGLQARSVLGGSEMLQCRLAQRIGQFGVVDGTGQNQRADHCRDCDQGTLVCGRLSPIG